MSTANRKWKPGQKEKFLATMKAKRLAANAQTTTAHKNPKSSKEHQLRYLYGIEIAEWARLFNKQRKRCAICGRCKPSIRKKWFTDHNHKTNKVRGILCGHCNAMLGYAFDRLEILKAAIKYLQRTTNES